MSFPRKATSPASLNVPHPGSHTGAGVQNGFQSEWPQGLWIAITVLVLLVPLIGYVLLPRLGINTLGEMLNLKLMVALVGLLVGGAIYWAYLRWALPRPVVLLGFIMLAWPLVDYCNEQLMQLGLNIHLRPLLILGLGLPALWLGLQSFRLLWKQLPGVWIYLLFIGWITLYAFLYNANASDPRLGGGEDAIFSEGSVSFVQWTAYMYCLLGMALAGVTVFKAKNYQRLFDQLNIALLWVSSLEALITIAGYPIGWFTIFLDGFTRSIGIFTHPNPFAHHMGVLMIYLLGLFCYYQGYRKARVPGWLLFAGLLVNFCAFLLGLSKTALGVFVLCATVVFLMNLAVPAVRRSFGKIVLTLIVLMPLGIVGFQALSGQSFMGLLESRIDQTQSLTWRVIVWQDLIADINSTTVWLGHGFTAANDTVFRLTFNDAKDAQPLMMVHNAYIALLYDFGLTGYLMFAAALTFLWQGLYQWFNATHPGQRSLHATIVALVIYFMVVCGFDEMSYMFDAPMLFWALVTLLASVAFREQQDERRRRIHASDHAQSVLRQSLYPSAPVFAGGLK